MNPIARQLSSVNPSLFGNRHTLEPMSNTPCWSWATEKKVYNTMLTSLLDTSDSILKIGKDHK